MFTACAERHKRISVHCGGIKEPQVPLLAANSFTRLIRHLLKNTELADLRERERNESERGRCMCVSIECVRDVCKR